MYSVSQKKCPILFKMLLLGPQISKMHSDFFPGSVCVWSTRTNLNFARRMHTVHTGIFCARCVFQMCSAEKFVFLTMCMNHNFKTRPPIMDLFFSRGHWGCLLCAHTCHMHAMCTLCTLSVLQCTKRARTITQQQNIINTFCFFMVVTGDVLYVHMHAHACHVHTRFAQYMCCQCTQCHNIPILA